MTLNRNNNNHITNNTKKLSVQFSLNGLSFLALNDKHEAVFKQKTLEQNGTPEELLLALKQELKNTNILLDSIEAVEIHYASTLYTLVPATLFDEKRSSDYLKFNSKILATDFIAHDHIKTLDLVVIYVPLMNINNYFFEAVGSFNYFHHISKLLEKSAAKFISSAGETVLINVREEEFDLIIYKDQTLQICNSYIFKSPEDFLYYILFTFEQLKIKPIDATIHIIGNNFKESDLFLLSKKYINTIILLDGNFKTLNNNDATHPTQLVLSN